MFSLFDWVRQRARDAFLAGLQDGVSHVTTGEMGGADTNLPVVLDVQLARRHSLLPQTESQSKVTPGRKARAKEAAVTE